MYNAPVGSDRPGRLEREVLVASWKKTQCPCEVCGDRVRHVMNVGVGRKPNGIVRRIHNACSRKWESTAKYVALKWVENRGLTHEQINAKRVAGGFQPINFSSKAEVAAAAPLDSVSVQPSRKESDMSAAGDRSRWRAPIAFEAWLIDWMRARGGLFSKDHYDALAEIRKDHHDDWYIINGSELTLTTLRKKMSDMAAAIGVKQFDIPYKERPEGVAPKSNQVVGTHGIRAMVESPSAAQVRDQASTDAPPPAEKVDPRDLMVAAIVDAITNKVRALERDRKYPELLALYEMLLK